MCKKGIAASACAKFDRTYVFFDDYLFYNITPILDLAFSEGPPPSSHRDLFKVDTFPGTLAMVLLGLKTSDSEPEELSSSSL